MLERSVKCSEIAGYDEQEFKATDKEVQLGDHENNSLYVRYSQDVSRIRHSNNEVGIC
jgi:hypothetical protein